MRVLFLHDVLNVADAGQIKEVAGGYARNYLLPRELAVPATPGRQNQLTQHLQAIEKRRGKEIDQQRKLAASIEGKVVSLTANVGSSGRLFGSITSNDIALALGEIVGTPIDRRKIDLTEPIRSVGEHEVPIRFSKDVVANFTVVVAGEGEPEEEQITESEALAAEEATEAEEAAASESADETAQPDVAEDAAASESADESADETAQPDPDPAESSAVETEEAKTEE